jgi:hypothetical protein
MTGPHPDVPLHVVIDRLRVASACPARWEDMTGNDTVRRCARCNLDVHNLSAMTRTEAQSLLSSRLGPDGLLSGRLCAGWRRRADGTIIFRECPVGVAGARAALQRSIARVAALVGLASFVGFLAARAERNGWDPRGYRSFALVSSWIGADGAAQTISAPGTFLLGDVYIPPPPASGSGPAQESTP